MIKKSLFAILVAACLTTPIRAHNSELTNQECSIEEVAKGSDANKLTSNQNIILSKEEAQSIAFMLKNRNSDLLKGFFLSFGATGFSLSWALNSIVSADNVTEIAVDILGATAFIIPSYWLAIKLIERGQLKVSLAEKIITKMRIKKIDPLSDTLINEVAYFFSAFTSLPAVLFS